MLLLLWSNVNLITCNSLKGSISNDINDNPSEVNEQEIPEISGQTERIRFVIEVKVQVVQEVAFRTIRKKTQQNVVNQS